MGIEPDPALEALGYFTVDGGGAAAAERLLELPDRPTALFAESDEMAYGALRAIRRAGLRVPDDIAVIGFDDQPLSELMDLSTVRQPVQRRRPWTSRPGCWPLISDDGDDAAADPDVVLPTELVVRGSDRPGAALGAGACR